MLFFIHHALVFLTGSPTATMFLAAELTSLPFLIIGKSSYEKAPSDSGYCKFGCTFYTRAGCGYQATCISVDM